MLKTKNISIIYKYFMSFLLIALIPILIMSYLLYSTNVANLKDKIIENRVTSITQLKSRMDYIIKDFSNIAFNVSSRYNIDDLFNQDATSDIDIISLVERYEQKLSQEAQILLYRRGSNVIYMSDGSMPYSVFEKRISSNYDMTMVRFYNRLNTSPSFEILSNKYFFSNEKEDMNLCFLYPLPYSEIMPVASIVFVVDDLQIIKLIKDYMGEFMGEFFIYNTYLDPVYHISFSADQEICDINEMSNKLAKLKGTGINDISLNGKKYVAVRTVSDDTGFAYFVLTTRDEFYKEIIKTKTWLYSFIVALLLTCVMFAIVLAVYYYRPISYILRLITDGFPLDGVKDELMIIGSYYKKLIDRNKLLLNQIERQRPIIKERCLRRLMQAGGKTDELNYYLQCANIQFDYSYYFVMIISLLSFDADISEVYKSIEEVHFDNTVGYGVELTDEGNMIGMIINTENGQLDPVEYSRRILEIINNKCKVQAVVGVGSPYKDISKCSVSFLEAKTALQFRDINSTKYIYNYSTTLVNNEDGYQYPTKEQALFIQSIRHGNNEIALTALNGFIDSIKRQSLSFIVVKYILFETINQMVRIAQSYDLQINVKETLKVSSLVNSIEDFKIKMTQLTDLICGGINAKKEENNREFKKNIIEYINKHYCEFDISMKKVANQFDISTSYLGRIIKEETESTFNEYITDLRIEKAKHLLRNTDEKVKDIVVKVGYMDAANFIRKFKKIENVTPEQYRTIKRYEGQKANNV